MLLEVIAIVGHNRSRAELSSMTTAHLTTEHGAQASKRPVESGRRPSDDIYVFYLLYLKM